MSYVIINSMYYNDGDIMKDKIISVRIMPNGYGKASEEVRNYILNLHDEIDKLQQENERLKYQLNQEKPNYLQIWQLEDRIYEASEFIKEKISSTKGVINDYMYHKEHNQHLIELLQEDIEMYKKELNILQNGSDNNEKS